MADATRVYAEATSSSLRILITENERMAKELQVSKKGGDLVTMSARAELKKAILDGVLSLDTVMRALYSKFGTMHQAIVHLHGQKHQRVRRARILKNIHAAIDNMQAWMMKYKGASLHLPKMMMANALSCKHVSRVRSRTMRTYRNSSLAYRLPMHEYSRAWGLWCTHM